MIFKRKRSYSYHHIKSGWRRLNSHISLFLLQSQYTLLQLGNPCCLVECENFRFKLLRLCISSERVSIEPVGILEGGFRARRDTEWEPEKDYAVNGKKVLAPFAKQSPPWLELHFSPLLKSMKEFADDHSKLDLFLLFLFWFS